MDLDLARKLTIWGNQANANFNPCSMIVVAPVQFTVNSQQIRSLTPDGDPVQIECTWDETHSVFRLFNSLVAIPCTLGGLLFLFKNRRRGLTFVSTLHCQRLDN
jgi:hypothetical protein